MPRHTDTHDRGPTNRHGADDEQSAGRRTMAELSHTNPTTGEAFGDSQVFERGTVAVVDGGEAGCGDEDQEPMAEVDHTPREGAPDAAQVYDRGVERVDEGDAEADATDDDTEGDGAGDG